MVTSFDISQEIFSIDMLTALKSSLKHRRKHVLRSLQLYGDQALIYLNCKRKTLVYSLRYTAFLVKNNTPLCGKFHHQNRLGHMLKPPNESCETLVFLELVPSQGRKSKNSNVNNFLSSLLQILIRAFSKIHIPS